MPQRIACTKEKLNCALASWGKSKSVIDLIGVDLTKLHSNHPDKKVKNETHLTFINLNTFFSRSLRKFSSDKNWS